MTVKKDIVDIAMISVIENAYLIPINPKTLIPLLELVYDGGYTSAIRDSVTGLNKQYPPDDCLILEEITQFLKDQLPK